MSTTIYFIRHGTSEAVDYLPGRKAGVNLSSVGIDQVKRMAGLISKIHIDEIFASPIDRTKQTAEIIADALNKEVIFSDDLMEIDIGEWTGKTFSELKNDSLWQLFNSFRSGTRAPKGEIILEVQARMVNKIELIRKDYPGKQILIISHGDPIRSALAYYLGLPLDFIFRFRIDTASLSILKINDYGPELICMNYKGDLTNLEL